MSLAFDPSYEASGRFYVHFTDRRDNIRVQAFRRSAGNPNRAARASRQQLLLIRRTSLQHAGGQLVFGVDGMLYVGIGDGGPAGDPENHAQDLGLLLGKILRIAPRPEGRRPYAIPDDNPFVDRAGARPEVWVYGLRNPYRFSFGPSGELYIADPGQDRREEISFAPVGRAAGSNFGWSCFEGTRRFKARLRCPGAKPPVLDYPDTHNRCAVVGGPVAGVDRGRLAGRFLYGDFCQGTIRTLAVRGGTVTDRSTGLHVAQLTGFGEDGRGRLYVTSLAGRVYRIATG